MHCASCSPSFRGVVARQLPLLQVGVFHFKGGGTVLAMNVVHALVDGSSFWSFLMDWSRLCRGLAPGGAVQERSVLFDLMQSLADREDTRQVMRRPSPPRRAVLYTRLGLQAARTTLVCTASRPAPWPTGVPPCLKARLAPIGSAPPTWPRSMRSSS